MKRKLKILYITIYLIILCLICSAFSSCNNTTSSDKEIAKTNYDADESEWLISEGELIVLENERIRFTMDSSTGHFTVKNLSTGFEYSSIPKSEVATYSDEDTQRMTSEVTVTYYEKQSVPYFFYSSTDCTNIGQMKIKYNDNSVRVYYNLGAVASFIPSVIDRETYEKSILTNLGNKAKIRKMNRFYTLYSKEDPPEDFEDIMRTYPALKNYDFYILNADELNDNELSIVDEYIKLAGYTESSYKKMLKKYGISDQSSPSKAGFTIPVEYKLTEDGFSASILTDLITEVSEKYILQSVDFLEYFSACAEDKEGYFIVPDGNGCIIPFNSDISDTFEQDFFGTDYAKRQSKQNQLSQNLLLPLFGISKSDGGLLAIVESAAECASLCVKTMSDSIPLNHAYTHFKLREVRSSENSDDDANSIYNIFSGHLLNTNPIIRYVLLEDNQNNYTEIAKYYRNYLKNNGLLFEKKENNSKAPLYLDFLCFTKCDDTFMGVPYQKEVVLSTLKEIEEIVSELHNSGWENINIRLCGYGKSGLENGVPNQFDISKKVGTIEQLKALSEKLESKGGKLYLDANVQFVYQTSLFDGFSQKNDSAHYLDRSIIYIGKYDTITREYGKNILPRFFVTPFNYTSYAKSFSDSLTKKCGNISVGISVGTIGKYLLGDYSSSKDLDRTQSAICVKKMLNNLSEYYSLMSDNGNSYVLQYTSDILNVPLNSSNFDIEYQAVPFYSTVIHSSVNYAGFPDNLYADKNSALLQSLEFGAMPYLVCITSQDDILTGSAYESSLYSLNADRITEFTSRWEPVKNFINITSNSKISNHMIISEGVRKTSYENGHGVVINYNDYSIVYNNETISAKGYLIY